MDVNEYKGVVYTYYRRRDMVSCRFEDESERGGVLAIKCRVRIMDRKVSVLIGLVSCSG